MINHARHLSEVVNSAVPLLKAISSKAAIVHPSPGAWSKKEIIGHLIDSAGNNQQKFVRMMQGNNLEFVRYDQDSWVKLQRYNYADWHQLIDLWFLCNIHLAHIITFVMPDKLQNKITIEGVGPFTLEFVMKDYIEHLKHHLKVALPDAGFGSKFENIYTQ